MPKTPTLLTFIGPSHHIQLLRPIEQSLSRLYGWKCERYTANTEACFQAGLSTYYPKEPYYWLPDYCLFPQAHDLYLQSVPLFQSLYTEPNELSNIHPVTLDRIVHSICEEYVATHSLLLSVRPSAVLALHEINRWGRLLGFHASRLNIPFFTLQEGLYYGHPWLYTNHTTYSTSLIWGEATKQLLLQSGASPSRLQVVGHPDLWSRKKAAQKNIPRYLPPAAKGKKVVFLFFTNISLTLTPTIMDGWQSQSDYYLIVRHHQLCSLPFVTHLKEFFSSYPNVHFSSDAPDAEPLPHWPLMEAANLALIFGTSSITLEWLSTPRPLGIFVSPLDFTRDFTKDPPLAVNCSNLSILQAVQKTASEWQANHSQAAQDWFASELCSTEDASDRIASIINTSIRKE